jgi:hypothetical protein
MDQQEAGHPPTKPMWRLAYLCATSDGVPRRSLTVALLVGTVLNLINQGDAILAMAPVSWLKVALTYCVPYAVCTYGAVSSRLALLAPGPRTASGGTGGVGRT